MNVQRQNARKLHEEYVEKMSPQCQTMIAAAEEDRREAVACMRQKRKAGTAMTYGKPSLVWRGGKWHKA